MHEWGASKISALIGSILFTIGSVLFLVASVPGVSGGNTSEPWIAILYLAGMVMYLLGSISYVITAYYA